MNIEEVYKQIAKEYGVSVEKVKMELQAGINEAYNANNKTDEVAAAQASIPCKGKIPTPDEFLVGLAKQIIADEKASGNCLDFIS